MATGSSSNIYAPQSASKAYLRHSSPAAASSNPFLPNDQVSRSTSYETGSNAAKGATGSLGPLHEGVSFVPFPVLLNRSETASLSSNNDYGAPFQERPNLPLPPTPQPPSAYHGPSYHSQQTLQSLGRVSRLFDSSTSDTNSEAAPLSRRNRVQVNRPRSVGLQDVEDAWRQLSEDCGEDLYGSDDGFDQVEQAGGSTSRLAPTLSAWVPPLLKSRYLADILSAAETTNNDLPLTSTNELDDKPAKNTRINHNVHPDLHHALMKMRAITISRNPSFAFPLSRSSTKNTPWSSVCPTRSNTQDTCQSVSLDSRSSSAAESILGFYLQSTEGVTATM